MWDYCLLKAHYIKEEWYRDGIPIWWDESERLTFDAKPRISKSRAAVERAQEKAGKSKNVVHGRYFIAEPKIMDGGDWPTREEWLEEQARKSGILKPVTGFEDSVPSIVQGRK